jgi:hypothetical protein
MVSPNAISASMSYRKAFGPARANVVGLWPGRGRRQSSRSKMPAAPIPPPTHIVTIP